jgi:Rv2525c-like, glycoside hydrolase-like domain/Putative peptidoglycan binding domain
MRRTTTRLAVLASAAALAMTGLDHPAAFAYGHPDSAKAPASSATSAVRQEARVSPPVKVPGSLDGLGFDACEAPSQSTMDSWRTTSPYWGVGVYIGGENRSCSQPNLTRAWVKTQHDRGWNVVPIWVDLQAPRVGGGTGRCVDHPFGGTTMSRSNATARNQGSRAADRAIARARVLGIAKGSTLFLDMESYKNDISACNQPVQNFQSGWSKRLRSLGWKSGYYSSLSTGINALDFVRTQFPGTYVMPDAVWFADADGRPNLDGRPFLHDRYWRGQRIHQYGLDVQREYGGIPLAIDQNAVLIGGGRKPGRVLGTCGVDLDFPAYRSWQRGQTSPQVSAAKCLLRRHGLYDGTLTERFTAATTDGVGGWQSRVGLTVTGRLNAATWTTLLAAGDTPLVKRGSTGDRVRYLQRAVTAARGKSEPINGVFGAHLAESVAAYQRAVGLPDTGVADGPTWQALQSGQR